MYTLVVVAAVLVAVSAQKPERTTPVPILKQINRHNDDGSYTFGYEGADGSFKIETKYPTGEVHGKYGYIGDDGKVREIEYGASRRGFEPSGTDIKVPPPVISNGLDYDDGQYKEDPDYYNEYKRVKANRKTSSGASRSVFKYQPQPAAPAPAPAPAPVPARAPVAAEPNVIRYTSPAAAPRWNPPQQQWNPPQQQWNAPQTYQTTPAPRWNPPQQQWNAPQYQNVPSHAAIANVNLQTGSYSLSYVG